MMNIWKTFEEQINRIFEFCNGKKVIIWGYGYGGWFLEHIFVRNNKCVDYVIDDGNTIPKMKKSRHYILESLNVDECAILLTFQKEYKTENYLKEMGFEKNKNFLWVREVLYDENEERVLSYYEWLEYFYKLDIVKGKVYNALEKKNNEENYSTGPDYALVEVIDNFKFTDRDAVFDFGCGKGGALLLFLTAGIRNIGGVEFDEELYSICLKNFFKLNIFSDKIYHDDATKIKEELDGYNYFYMYNPFSGETFEKVIKNIEDSFKRNPRRVTLIYTNPCLHKKVIANGIFKLTKVIDTDFSLRNVNIYTISI